jgi:hypothetical protein
VLSAARQAGGVGACGVGTAATVREASEADSGAVVRFLTATKAAAGAAGAQLSARNGATPTRRPTATLCAPTPTPTRCRPLSGPEAGLE